MKAAHARILTCLLGGACLVAACDGSPVGDCRMLIDEWGRLQDRCATSEAVELPTPECFGGTMPNCIIAARTIPGRVFGEEIYESTQIACGGPGLRIDCDSSRTPPCEVVSGSLEPAPESCRPSQPVCPTGLQPTCIPRHLLERAAMTRDGGM